MKRLLAISLALVLALSLSIGPIPAQPALAGSVFKVPSNYSTIQAGINAASTAGGGTVLVAAGTYSENIQLESGVGVVSDRTGNTTISGSSSFPVVTANSVTNAKLDGFTITNGSGTQLGAGVSIQANSSNVTISNCVITGNTASLRGGGISIDDSSAVIVNCTIINNTVNKIGELGGTGGGIYIVDSSPTIINCITANNTALSAGGGIYVDTSSSPNITHNDVCNNSPNNYAGIADQTGTNGNISQDPKFAGVGDYHLDTSSPCIDTGDNSATNLPETDKDGKVRMINGTVDMGAYEYGEVAPPNQPPVAEAGDNTTYTLEVSQPTINVTLNGSNSTDSDGTIVAYTWTGTPDPDDVVGPNVTLDAGVHIFTLVVTDDDDAMSDPDTVTITVNEAPPPPNQPPVAEAGDNTTYTLEVSQPTINVTLNGSNSTDSDGTIVAYTWTGTPDPDDVVGPNVTLDAGVHIFTLVVTDDDDAMSDPDTVTITVNEAMSECEFQTFIISHMTIDWAKDTGNQDNKWKWGSWFKWFRRSTPKNDDTFSIRGRIKLPKGYTVADLEESVVVSVSITDGSGKDTVSFREWNLRKRGAMWWYRGSVQPPGEGMNITKITIWWTPQSGEWAGWARFNIKGVLEFPEDIGMNTTPAEAAVTVQIPVSVEDCCGSLLGEETVEFKVSGKSNRWYY